MKGSWSTTSRSIPAIAGPGLEGPSWVRRSRGAARRVGRHLSLHPRADDGEPGPVFKDRGRRVRPTLPRSVLSCLPAQAPWMSLPMSSLGPPRGGQDPGSRRRGRQQEMTLTAGSRAPSRPSSSWPAPAHRQGDPAGRVDGHPDSGVPGQAPARPSGGIWGLERQPAGAFRATCLRRTWTAGCFCRAWRSVLPQRHGG